MADRLTAFGDSCSHGCPPQRGCSLLRARRRSLPAAAGRAALTDPAARNPKAPARGRTIQADRPSRHHPTIAAPRAARGARSGQPLSVPASRRLASVASRERDADAEATAAKVASTVLPAVNPIDAGCLPRGWPVDHLGHADIWCPRCEGQGLAANQPGELFRVVCGSGFGFGTLGSCDPSSNTHAPLASWVNAGGWSNAPHVRASTWKNLTTLRGGGLKEPEWHALMASPAGV